MITITGLGPGDLARVPSLVKTILLDPSQVLILRTIHHPAAAEISAMRETVMCDDLYESLPSFEEVYSAIADRVITAASDGDVVYAVPGSPMIGEFAVREILARFDEVDVIPAESFVDAVVTEMGYDPLDRGLQIINGHDLPDPLVLDKPTIVGHLDRPEILADVCAAIDRVTPEGSRITLLAGIGSSDATVSECEPADFDFSLAGYRTSLFIDVAAGGLIGAVRTMRVLREKCPWDVEQTHRSLIKNLVEESYELIDAISRMDPEIDDLAAYAEVEDELGDVLLQVLFHSVIARQKGVFDIDDVAEVMRQKLVRRHPHVFGDTEVSSASEVKTNWDRIKQEESGIPKSALDGVPSGMPGLHRASKIQNRAAKVGFDWEEATQVLPRISEELDELADAIRGEGDIEDEVGDLMFSVVNMARHLGVDTEVALRRATDRFEDRFRKMEADGPLQGLDLAELDARWEKAKNS